MIFCLQFDDFCLQFDYFCLQFDDFCLQFDDICLQVDDCCLQVDDFCLQFDYFCLQFDDFCLQFDDFFYCKLLVYILLANLESSNFLLILQHTVHKSIETDFHTFDIAMNYIMCFQQS